MKHEGPNEIVEIQKKKKKLFEQINVIFNIRINYQNFLFVIIYIKYNKNCFNVTSDSLK